MRILNTKRKILSFVVNGVDIWDIGENGDDIED